MAMAVLNVNVFHQKCQAPYATPKEKGIKAQNAVVWSTFRVKLVGCFFFNRFLGNGDGYTPES